MDRGTGSGLEATRTASMSPVTTESCFRRTRNGYSHRMASVRVGNSLKRNLCELER